MNWMTFGVAVFIVSITGYIQAEKPGKLAPKSTLTYRLTDLGVSNIPLEKLVATESQSPLTPKLNNRGEIIANRASGGFIKRVNGEFFTPHMPEAVILFHSINANGDLLVSINHPQKKVEWAIWGSVGEGSLSQRKALVTNQLKEKFRKIYFSAITDKKLVTGYFLNKKELPQTVVWDDANQKMFSPVLSNDAKALLGKWQGVNNLGIIYGFYKDDGVLKPAVWGQSQGFTPMKNYRPKIVPEGTIMLEALAMNDDGVAYGTYWVEYKDASPLVAGIPKVYYNFAWQPTTGAFKQLDIDGMLVAKVNGSHTLMGSLNGKPALCEAGKKPVEFATLIYPDQSKEWEIIRLSDINDGNHLVGIGKYQDSIHFFYAEPDHE